MLEVANLIAVAGGDTTAHEARQRVRCNKCGVKGINTHQFQAKRTVALAEWWQLLNA